MHYRVLQDALRRTPFEPFNVVMSSGEKYEVKHPETMVLMKDAAAVPIYSSYEDDGRPDRHIYASYLHIWALEPLLSPPKLPRRRRSR